MINSKITENDLIELMNKLGIKRYKVCGTKEAIDKVKEQLENHPNISEFITSSMFPKDDNAVWLIEDNKQKFISFREEV